MALAASDVGVEAGESSSRVAVKEEKSSNVEGRELPCFLRYAIVVPASRRRGAGGSLQIGRAHV